MDKKKVEDLIDKALHYAYVGRNRSLLENFNKCAYCLEDALKELSKSDWVSVEDDLPKYGESVLVCNEKDPSDMWFAHRTADRNVVVDEHEFAKGYGEITHWQRFKGMKK